MNGTRWAKGHGQKYFFGYREDEIIKTVYQGFKEEGTSRGVAQTARRALGGGYPAHIISKRASHLGCAFDKRPAPWSEAEIQKLEQLCEQGLSERAIARRLGRTETAIHIRKYRSGIHKGSSNTYTLKELADVLGETEKTVKSWIDSGKLPGEKPEGSNFYTIHRNTVLTFIKNYRGMIRLYRVEPVSFLDLILGDVS